MAGLLTRSCAIMVVVQAEFIKGTGRQQAMTDLSGPAEAGGTYERSLELLMSLRELGELAPMSDWLEAFRKWHATKEAMLGVEAAMSESPSVTSYASATTDPVTIVVAG